MILNAAVTICLKHVCVTNVVGSPVVLTQYDQHQQHCGKSSHRVIHHRQIMANLIQVVMVLHYNWWNQEANGYPQLSRGVISQLLPFN
jgi:hypothetical protein